MINNDTALNIKVPADLHERLRLTAFRRRMSMSAVVREALEQNLGRDDDGTDNARRAG